MCYTRSVKGVMVMGFNPALIVAAMRFRESQKRQSEREQQEKEEQNNKENNNNNKE